MFSANRHVVTVTLLLAFGFASQALAQPDVNPPPPLTGHGSQIGEHRRAALKMCTDGIKFDSDRYVTCMTKQGEEP
jgi:hypothetical protein